jgi:branched-chain amino acid transport system permease protein
MNDITVRLRRNQTLIITLAVLFALFVMAARGMSTKDWVITTLRGLSSGAVIFLVAAGFSIVLGLMDVFNMAQGTVYMIGAYVGWSVYIRPDTFVDLLTPLALLVVGFLLNPLWNNLLDRLRLSPRVARTWPWVGLILALAVLLLTLPHVPIALWDWEDYQDSPIVWTQNFTLGTRGSLLEPASFDVPPLVVMGGMLLGSALAAASLVGFQRRRRAGSAPRRLPWSTFVPAFVLVGAGIGAHVFNDALTEFLLDMNTTWLFLIAVAVATLTGAALGGLMEVAFIRPLYARPLYQILMTLGLGAIGIDIVRELWGRNPFTFPRPSIFDGSGDGCPATNLSGWLEHQCSTLSVTIRGDVARIRVYNEIFLILVGLVMLVVIWALIQRTRLGMIIRAGVQDSEMVEALGINVRRVFTLVFALGVGTAALGGALSGPLTGLSDQMGVHLLLVILVTLAIGGLTSYPGAFVGAAIVGLVQQFITKYGQIGIKLPFMDEPFKPSPPLVPASTVLLMVIILLIMPQGLLGRKE